MFHRRRWRPSTTAYGRAAWAAEPTLRAWGMLGGDGLILGRTASGKLIRLRNFCHVLLCGGTGSGKGVSIIIPQLLSYKRGSCVCFDTKGDLFIIAAQRRKNMGQRIIRLAPFGGGTDTLNPLDCIRPDCPTLVDDARAMAEALVVRQGSEPDPHWNDKSVQVICALLTLVLARFQGKERNLNMVAEIASDPALLEAAADKLREMGGIYARFGNQLRALLDKEQPGTLTKEGAGILSTVGRHLSFLDSDLVAASVARSTFLVKDLLKPGMTLFLQIPPDQLEAQRGLLRCWLSTLIRVIGRGGDERSAEVLFLVDEASALGGGLQALEEALVRGRSAGVRLLLAYQSDSQIRAAFKDKPTLLYDNCDTQIYLGASSYETAERISKMCGDWTQVLSSYGENESRSYSPGGLEGQRQGPQTSRGSSENWSLQGRNLLRPEEILTLNRDLLIAFVRGMQPILARRVKYFSDPAFSPAAARARRPMLLWWALLAASVGLIAWAAWAWR